MPISKANKDKYPTNWKEVRQHILERAKNMCEKCEIANYSIVTQFDEGRLVSQDPFSTFKEARKHLKALKETGSSVALASSVVVLTIAHLNHDPTDCRDENLMAMCQRCHLAYDKDLHQKNAARTRRARLK